MIDQRGIPARKKPKGVTPTWRAEIWSVGAVKDRMLLCFSKESLEEAITFTIELCAIYMNEGHAVEVRGFSAVCPVCKGGAKTPHDDDMLMTNRYCKHCDKKGVFVALGTMSPDLYEKSTLK